MLLCLILALLAAPQDPPKKPIETAHLSITTSVENVALGKLLLVIGVTPKPKMHVYSPGQDGYIAIALTLESSPAFTAAKAKYPAGEKYLMPALNETQLVYAKPFRITQEITIKSVESGADPLVVRGTLRYQACDDQVCYLPQRVPVEWRIRD